MIRGTVRETSNASANVRILPFLLIHFLRGISEMTRAHLLILIDAHGDGGAAWAVPEFQSCLCKVPGSTGSSGFRLGGQSLRHLAFQHAESFVFSKRGKCHLSETKNVAAAEVEIALGGNVVVGKYADRRLMNVGMGRVAHKVGSEIEANGRARRSVVVKGAAEMEDEAGRAFVPVFGPQTNRRFIANESRPGLRVQAPRAGSVAEFYAEQGFLGGPLFTGEEVELRAEVEEPRQAVGPDEAGAWVESGATRTSPRYRGKMLADDVEAKLPSWLVFPGRLAVNLLG